MKAVKVSRLYITFLPVPKRFTIFLIYFHFNIILHCFFYHSIYYGFILSDIMAVTSEQNVFVAPYLGLSLVEFIGSVLELC